MKRKLLTTLTAALLALSAWAAGTEINGIYYELNSFTKTASVTYTGSYSYSGSITIPASVTYDGTTYSVTSIGEGAFIGCFGLTSVTALRTNPEAYNCHYNAFYDVNSLHVPAGCKKAYENCRPWSYFSSIIDDAKAK